MTALEQAPCGCRFGSQDGAFVFVACSPDCDLTAYVQAQAKELGQPCTVVDLSAAGHGPIVGGTSAPIVTSFRCGHGHVVDKAMQQGLHAVAGFTVTLDNGQVFSGCGTPEDCRGMIAALLASSWAATHEDAPALTREQTVELRDALDLDPSRLAEVIAAGRRALG